MRRIILAFLLVLSACSTSYYSYTGSEVYQGHGGAARRVNGIDIWLTGEPNRPYRIIGYITDSRPGGPIAMAVRDGSLAAMAQKQGGDGILLGGEQSHFMGNYNMGTASFFTPNTAFGSGTSIAMVRREGQFYVIKYM
jgi:hypothetical protein